MSQVTVEQFANAVGIPVEKLLSQLGAAGLPVKGAGEAISDKEKLLLLRHLRQSHGVEGEALAVAEPKKVTVKRKTVSEVRQVTSTGKTKTVNVEVRGRRTLVKRGIAAAEEMAKLETHLAERGRQEAEERAVLDDVRQREIEERQLREQEAARLKAEQERRLKEEQEAKRKAEEETRRKTEEETRRKTVRETKPKVAPAAPAAAPRAKEESIAEREAAKKGKHRGEKEERVTKYGREELHVAAEKTGFRRKKVREKPAPFAAGGARHGFEKPTAPIVREVNIPETITVAELAQKMSVKAVEVIKALMKMGSMVTINQVLDQDTAAILVEEMGHTPRLMRESALEEELAKAEEVTGEKVTRAPVVTIMGHVDHGKTSLLDYIRRTKVAAGEAGGITQHIGAYHVETDKGMITFLDTPGHEAFTAMRARGARVTDIVVLVVAADDGVMPQTMEAIQHAKAGNVPLVVAVNKIDKPAADAERVKQELVQQGVIPEEWGGENIFAYVSAKTGAGVDELLDAILVQAEVLELTAVKDSPASGVVIESTLDKGRGPVATILVKNGTLRKGDILLSGQEYGRVRAMLDEAGKHIEEAGPSTPVVVLGLSGTPNAGDPAVVVAEERKAREIALFRQGKFRDVKLARQQATKLEDVFSQIEKGKVHALNLVVKADVQGSVEALREALTRLSSDEVQVKVIASGVGGINESDVNLAIASQAVMVGFNVRADASARRLAADAGIDLHYYSIIYDVIDEVKRSISGMLAPEIKEQIVGLAEVRDVFRSPKLGAIAGCLVVEGMVKRNNPIRVLRDNVVIYEGQLESLRRFKDDVSEVRSGTECGIGVKDYNDVRVGDQIEVYERVEVARTI
ncbi:MAG: translation initiation factor IF-2 [Gammaproteobacteria bacterium]|nr:translation initiation factor IF-2 [Gammaproteobacteria bacterium]